MKILSSSRNSHSRLRTGFTLIELLVVIGIIALLAALIVGGAAIASTKMRQSRVEAERNAIVLAIERYHKVKGYYPPDNTNNTIQTALFYELTGTVTIYPANSTTPSSFRSPISGETLTVAGPNQVLALFNLGGFLNSSNSPDNPSANFYESLKVNQHEIVAGTGAGNGYNYTVLGVGVPGPLQLSPATAVTGGFQINPWHYVSSNPTNNVDSYDLWMDVSYGGKTNRISNWSKDPQIVSY